MADHQFHWLERCSAEYTEFHPCRRSHADPTADAAIGSVMREEKKKRHREPHRQNRKKTVTQVWRANEEEK